jgi:hypothetical protein
MNSFQGNDPTFLVFMGLLGLMLLYVVVKIFQWLGEYWIYVKARPFRVLYLPFQIVFLPLRILGALLKKEVSAGAGNSAGDGQTPKSIVAVTNHGGRFQVQFNDRSSTSLSAGGRDYELVGYTSETVSIRKVTGNIHHTLVYQFRNGRLVGQTTRQ